MGIQVTVAASELVKLLSIEHVEINFHHIMDPVMEQDPEDPWNLIEVGLKRVKMCRITIDTHYVVLRDYLEDGYYSCDFNTWGDNRPFLKPLLDKAKAEYMES